MSIFLKKLHCFIFGHKYVVTQKLTQTARRCGCRRCNKSFAMNDDLELITEWDSDFHRLYERFGIEIKYQPWEYK